LPLIAFLLGGEAGAAVGVNAAFGEDVGAAACDNEDAPSVAY